ncbi:MULTISPECIES: SpoIIE family protein phosphatase [Streptomyces]|uniref:SpoIIE family protein phosphatase n=1 Tax=Streptomyces TaxID=1883 RepID=UPI001CCE0EC2|nr:MULTISPECIES: SpoIIE family protein phosphatase [Streptomyces]MBZ6138978.1 SpoIIE family protein phosphatase [Streptomyces olivaceus]MBZ6166484.1 SpoIIE family protein phosphatase [Streptomyces olivaceus]MCM8550975.1 SpoIIE family protein phosphatase [Streptomyces sp. STCH 565 A]
MDSAMAAVVRASGAFGGILYALPPGEDALWQVLVAGVPEEMAAPWRRVALDDPMPVADAVRDRELTWCSGREEMARQYPRVALVLPYEFALAAAPVVSGGAVRGALVLLWPGGRPADLDPGEREVLRTGCRRLAECLRRAADRGDPLRPADRPRTLPPPAPRTPSPAEATALSAFVGRLPGGSCALDLEGRITFVTPGAAGLLGADRAGLVGALPWEALPWMDVPHVEDRYRAALVSRRPQAFTVLRPPGTWLSFELYPDATGLSVRITRGAPDRDRPPDRPGTGSVPGRATVLYHLMHLASTLTEAVGVDEVVEQTAGQLMPALGAQAMVVMAPEDGRLKIVGHRGYDAGLMERYDAAPLTSDIPAVDVMATGLAGFWTTFAELHAAYPATVHEDGMAAWAVLPLIASGRPIGSLLLAYARPHVFPPGERAALTSLAGLVGQALDRARLYDAKDHLAHRLQAALLPHTLPRLPRLNVAARYLPAARGLGVGGDFYDLIRLDEHTAGAAIGDVQGHNVDAAALMGQVRTAVHAHATVGAPPDDVLARTNRLLTDLDPGLFASCAYVHLDLAVHRACVALAGHPPPLVRHADGRVEPLRVPPGLLLGIEADSRCPAVEFPFPAGSVLALYTDGLVEAPGVDIDDAIAALGGLLEHGDPADLDGMADTLVRHAPTPGDDIALLLLSPRG